MLIDDPWASAIWRVGAYAAFTVAGALMVAAFTQAGSRPDGGRGSGWRGAAAALACGLFLVTVMEVVGAVALTGGLPGLVGALGGVAAALLLLALAAWRLGAARVGLTLGHGGARRIWSGAALVAGLAAVVFYSRLLPGGGLTDPAIVAPLGLAALATELAYRGALFGLLWRGFAGDTDERLILAIAGSSVAASLSGLTVVGGDLLILKAALAVGLGVSVGFSVLRAVSGSLIAPIILAVAAALGPLVL